MTGPGLHEESLQHPKDHYETVVDEVPKFEPFISSSCGKMSSWVTLCPAASLNMNLAASCTVQCCLWTQASCRVAFAPSRCAACAALALATLCTLSLHLDYSALQSLCGRAPPVAAPTRQQHVWQQPLDHVAQFVIKCVRRMKHAMTGDGQ